MNFTELKLEDRPKFEQWFSINDSMMSHNDFVTVYAWDINDKTVYSTDDDVLTIRNTFDGETVYFHPIARNGGCARATLAKIREYEGSRPFTVTSIPDACLEKVRDLPGYGAPIYDRDNSDYIYKTQDLILLAGKKLHSKRNFYHRFTERYDYDFRDYKASDFDAVMGLYDAWHGAPTPNDYERTAIIRVMEHARQLGVKCGLLFVDGVLIAMGAVSVSVRGIGQVHFEKALDGYEGAYAAINRMCAEAYLSDTKWINRQEDMGIEGLRKAKLSYHPALILEKYRMGSVN